MGESVIQPMTFEEMMGSGAKVISLKKKKEMIEVNDVKKTSLPLNDLD